MDADDVTIDNLGIRNTTPRKGSQAEALRLEGERGILRNCDFYSYQDTLLLNGRVYVTGCYIEGDVDFVWGHGTTFFESCESKALHDGYYVTARNPQDRFGLIFSNCKLSAVAFIRCQMGPHIPKAAWLITGEDFHHLRFFEYGSTSSDGIALPTEQRHPASR